MPVKLLTCTLVEGPELLGVRLSITLEEIMELDEDLRSDDGAELDGAATVVDELDSVGADGLKMTMAKISSAETLLLCASYCRSGVHVDELSMKEAARQSA